MGGVGQSGHDDGVERPERVERVLHRDGIVEHHVAPDVTHVVAELGQPAREARPEVATAEHRDHRPSVADVALTRDELIDIAHEHAAAEAGTDIDRVLVTLDPDPVYELQPVGLVFRGMAAARTYYEHFFATFRPTVAGYQLRNEWVADDGVGQEYVIDVRADGGAIERHAVIGILTFGEAGLSGERLYAGERMLRLMFGPAFDLAEPLT